MVERLNNATGVLAALRSLQGAQRDVSSANNRLSSGLEVSRAADDATRFQAAAAMRGEGGSLKTVMLSLGRAQSISDTAISAGQQISKLLIEMRNTAGQALAGDLSPEQRAVYAQQFNDQRTQLETFVRKASFDDANLLDGSKPLGVTFIADPEAEQTVTLQGRNFLPGGPIVTVGAPHGLETAVRAKAAYDAIGESIDNVGRELTGLAAENKRVTAQIGFVSKLADALAAGVGRLVDADMAAESALIQALQVKQELGAGSISIANEAPQALLALFRS
jgi:flagellin